MRATVIAIALGALAACKGKAAPKSTDAAVAAADAPGAVADAERPWYALPIDASPDAKQFASGQLPFLGGDWGAVEISAVDAPVGRIMIWLAADRQLLIVAAGSGLVRGYASGQNVEDLADTLHAAFPNAVPEPIRKPKGKAEGVDLSFVNAPAPALYRVLGDIARHNYVLGPGDVLKVDVSAKRVPADAVALALAQAIGRGTVDTVGNTTYVHDPAGAELDQALVKLGGPTIDIDIEDGKPGEAYAAINAIGGAVGGVACSDGTAFSVRLRKVKAGVAAAVVAALGGVAPGAASCTATPTSRASVTAVRVIASAGKHRIAIVNDAAAPGLLDGKNEPAGTIGDSYVYSGTSTVQLDPSSTSLDSPPWDPGSNDVPAWANYIGKARLAATLIDNDRRVALIELPDGTWQSLSNIGQNYYSDFQYTIGSGRLWFYLRQGSGTPIEGSLILQEK